MKRRILAFLLMCLMVVTMVPFAAFADDVHQHSATCPGKGEIHRLTNCPEAKLIEVVAPICGEDGYTIYQCPECGDYFADNFIKQDGEHKWEILEARVEPTCTTAGKTEKRKCSVCGKIEGGEVIPANGHDRGELVQANVPDCMGGNYDIYKCRICGENFKVLNGQGGTGEHTWGEPVILKAPTLTEHGTALYTCTLCGETKEVDVWFDHTCELVHHDAVAPTCTTNGNIEYWECMICGKHYSDAAGTTVVTDITVAKRHTSPVFVRTEKASCTEVGYNYYHCDTCNTDYREEIPATNHSYSSAPTSTIDPTCERYGFKFYACTVCGMIDDSKTEVIKPTGHSAFNEAADGVEIPAKCGVAGSRTWTCTNPNCDAESNHVVVTLPALEHKFITVKKAATCNRYAYEFTYCENEGCPDYANVTTKTVDDTTYDVTIKNAEGVSVGVNLVTFRVTGNVFDANNHVLKTDPIKPATCTEGGSQVTYCPNCNEYHVTENIPALGHNFDKNSATCGAPTVTCSRCDATKTFEVPHTPIESTKHVVAPTCQADGYTEYECSVCHTTYQTNPTTYTPVTYYLNYEEASAAHPQITESDPDREIYRAGSCTIIGLYRHQCPDCNEYVLVVIDGTGSHHEPTDAEYLAANKENPWVSGGHDQFPANLQTNCSVAGYTAQYVCTECGKFIASEEQAVKEHTWVLDSAGTPNTCTTAGVKAKAHCSVCGIIDPERDGSVIPAAHDYEVHARKDATCFENGYEEYRTCKRCDFAEPIVVINAYNHSIYTVVDTVSATCEGIGYVLCKCDKCDNYEFMKEYKPAIGHDWVLDPAQHVDPGCETKGVDVYVCSHDATHTKSVDIAALGHINEAGHVFYNDCQDKETDRNCTRCGNENVGKQHNDVFESIVPSTCKEYGYIIKVCRNCDWKEVTNIEYLEAHTWGEWVIDTPATIKSEGAQHHICSVCGEREDVVIPAKEGVEFVIDIENTIKKGAEYADGTVIAVKVSLESLKTELWGVQFDLAYNKNLVEYVRYEFVTDKFITQQTVNNVTGSGYVRVLANTANDASGNSTNVAIEGKEEFIVLYFRVKTPNAGVEISFQVNNRVVLKNDDTEVYTENAPKSITTVKFLDVNSDGDINLMDALIAYKMITGELTDMDYDIAVDVDKDGKITLQDFQYIYEYLAEIKNYDAMVKIGR